MLIKLTRIRKNNKFSKYEFLITKMLLDALYIEYEDDHSISKNCSPIFYGDKSLNFPEHYSYINDFGKDKPIFRPLKNERHSNILIEMFEEYNLNIDIDKIEITEFINDKNKKRFSGYVISNGEILKNSVIKSSPSIPMLKSSIVAKLLLSKKDYNEYRDLLIKYLNEQKELNSCSN